MILPIDAYDQREAEARVLATYPALRAFSTHAFNAANFPSRVSNEIELRRYADIMYETLSRTKTLSEGRYSLAETDAMIRVSDQIESLTGRLFQAPIRPLMCLFPPIDLLRMVEHLATLADRKLTVLEIGPGSGYLSVYLLNAGHRVIAVDVCQSLYLWQNRLFNDYVLDEWAAKEAGIMPRPSPSAEVVHIPWWHFARFHETLPIKADVVICDAALGEMEHFGFRYVIEVAKILSEQSSVGCLLYQNLGEERFQQRTYVEQYAATRGFRLQHVGGVSVLIGSDKFPVEAIAALSEPATIGDGKATQSADEFLGIERAKQLESYAFFDFIGLGN